MSSLPLRAKAVVLLAGIAGAAVLAAGLRLGANTGIGPVLTVVTLAAFVAGQWVFPLLIYRGAESEAVHLDEGFFIVLALVLPPAGAILAFSIALLVGQIVRRRPLLKSVFNFGQMLAAVGLGLLAVHLIAPPAGHLTPASIAASLVGAAVFFCVNTGFLGAILSATGGGRFLSVVTEGVEIRLLLVGACVGTGVVAALALSAYGWAFVVAGIPFAILRQVLAGHFQSRHDRERTKGLFDATLEANRSMGADEISAAICRWSATLLRCPEAAIVDTLPATPHLAASVDGAAAGKWLVVTGRSKAEPFDSADQSLLEALAAVGSGAFANASLYGQVHRQQERLSTIASTLGEGVCAVDRDGNVTFANPMARQLLGLSAADMAAIDAPQGYLRLDFLQAPAMQAITSSATVRADDTFFRNRDGSTVSVAFTCSPILEDGEAIGAVVAFRDIAERKAFEERLAHHAFHDALTGLPNRRVFLDRLDHALGRSRRRGETHAVLFADVDRFKVVNDGIGHLGGDHLLIAIAERLSSALRPGDTLARFGGDEYTILLEDISSPAEARAVATRILAMLDAPILLPSGHEIVATLSVGIALADPGSTADDVLHNADVAMYQAKARGPGRLEIFDPAAMGGRSADRVELESALRKAIEEDELEVHYQPIFTNDGERIVGTEALVRWRHPERGLIAPDAFIGLAEETGLIVALGAKVLETACRDARRWEDTYGVPRSVSVNLSARQFAQPDLIAQVDEVLAATRLSPSSLCLEITETVAVQDVDRTIATLFALKQLGVRLAIDDFGTGYSSLNYLKQFPVDVVKLDRGFIAGLEENSVDAAIVAAVVGLADAIGMTIVAEGVETQAQVKTLRELGCPFLQGYLLARPMQSTDIDLLLQAQQFSSDDAALLLI